jgi:UrcA family protein
MISHEDSWDGQSVLMARRTNLPQVTHPETAMNRITTTILTVALSATAHLASAADPTDSSPRHVEVHYADLNLSTAAGAAALYQRLHSAADTVCNEHGTRDLASQFRSKACVRAAISAAVTQIDRPLLTAYHRAKLGWPTAAARQAAR